MPLHLQGHRVCQQLQYSLDLNSEPPSAIATAAAAHLGQTTDSQPKFPSGALSATKTAVPRKHKQDNGVTREFCDTCGAFICEDGEEAADKFRCIMWGTLDEPEKTPPKRGIQDIFHKHEIKQ
ncbi:hypothetical protein B0T14DRAFT_545448 [Immersiella caudata]|uniref:CENP-V/GFA domain-containing protein n=1 Tax=Immersiella caudata TaxID=314043 RepID=A0AA39WP53_9PEZI|nr:hypothetical protein B0T14DRAFT_545448 [Immersiella caudata]